MQAGIVTKDGMEVSGMCSKLKKLCGLSSRLIINKLK